MDKLKYIKLENPDGSYSDSIPITVDSNAVEVNGGTLTDTLATLATKTEVQAVASGSPAGVYATVAALTSADPDHSKIYVVTTDGHWYYYNNGWTDGGIYQSAGYITNKELSAFGEIADAKNTGVQIKALKDALFDRSDINYFDRNNIVDGMIDYDGSIKTNGSYANYYTSDFIKLKANEDYIMYLVDNYKGFTGARLTYAFYTLSGTLISGSRVSEFEYTMAVKPTTECLVRVSIPKDFVNNLMLVKGTSRINLHPYIDYDVSKNEDYNSIETTYTENLVSLDTCVEGGLQSNGTITTSGSWINYYTTDYILVRGSTKFYISYDTNIHTAQSRITYCCYNREKEAISYESLPSVTEALITVPSNTTYVRISFPKVNSDITMFNRGETKLSYQPFKILKLKDEVQLGAAALAKIDEKIAEAIHDDPDTAGKIQVIKSGNSVNLRKEFGEGILIQNFLLSASNYNHTFEFNGAEYRNASNQTIATKPEGDDITPIRIQGLNTVGANHGYPCAVILNNTDKTQDDVGSIWTDGSKQYLLVKYDNTKITLIPEYTLQDGRAIVAVSTAPAADLTHVSGATHTNTISISGYTTGQLYPSLNNIITELFIDDEKITEDGTYYADKITFKESYNIMSYKGIWDYLTTHVGSYLGDNNITPIVSHYSNYNIEEIGKCTVTTTLVIREKCNILDCGFLQSSALSIPNQNTLLKRYVDGSKPIGNYDFTNVADITSYDTSIKINQSDLIDTTKPSNRIVDWLVNSTNNKKIFGYTVGYFIDKGDTKTETRINNIGSNSYIDLRNTKKIYPVAITGLSLEPNDNFTICGYRTYLDPAIKSTNANVIKYGNDTYLFFDAHESGQYSIDIDTIGKDIEIIESKNVDINNVANNPLILFVTNNYGYIILKLK